MKSKVLIEEFYTSKTESRHTPAFYLHTSFNEQGNPSTAGRDRTGTPVTRKRILSPSRLPIPPRRHTRIFHHRYTHGRVSAANHSEDCSERGGDY